MLILEAVGAAARVDDVLVADASALQTDDDTALGIGEVGLVKGEQAVRHFRLHISQLVSGVEDGRLNSTGVSHTDVVSECSQAVHIASVVVSMVVDSVGPSTQFRWGGAQTP